MQLPCTVSDTVSVVLRGSQPHLFSSLVLCKWTLMMRSQATVAEDEEQFQKVVDALVAQFRGPAGARLLAHRGAAVVCIPPVFPHALLVVLSLCWSPNRKLIHDGGPPPHLEATARRMYLFGACRLCANTSPELWCRCGGWRRGWARSACSARWRRPWSGRRTCALPPAWCRRSTCCCSPRPRRVSPTQNGCSASMTHLTKTSDALVSRAR